MKSFLLLMLLIVFVVIGGMGSVVYAQPEEVSFASDVITGVITEEVVNLLEFDLGISGDAFYPLSGERAGKLLDGISLKTIAIKGELASINLVIADMLSERSTLYGIGVSVNIPLLVEDVFNGKWLADVINPSIGLAALADFDAEGRKTLGIDKLAIDTAIHLQVIKYQF